MSGGRLSHIFGSMGGVPGDRDGLVRSVCPLGGGGDHDGRGLVAGNVIPRFGEARPASSNSEPRHFTRLDVPGRLAAVGSKSRIDGRGVRQRLC